MINQIVWWKGLMVFAMILLITWDAYLTIFEQNWLALLAGIMIGLGLVSVLMSGWLWKKQSINEGWT
jgi:hypothetical protein